MILRVAGIFALFAIVGAGCSSGSGGVTVDVTISGDGVDQALIYPDARRAAFATDVELDDPYEYLGESMVVDLPWSTTVSISDGLSTKFEVAAFNEGDSGVLTCAADWNQADGDGDWDRSNSYLVSCSGDFRFRDDREVRLDPGGRSVSFEARDERFAEIAEAKRLDAVRIARVEEANTNATPAGPVELDGWLIELTGVDPDAKDLLEAYSTRNRFNGSRKTVLTEVTATRLANAPGRASDIRVGALGGYDLKEYEWDDDDCGPHIPDSYLTTFGLLEEQEAGDTVVYNTCLILDEEDVDDAIAVISVFLGDDAPITMRFPTPGLTGTGPDAVSEGDIVEFVGFDTGFDLRVVGATIDDVELLGQRLGEEIRQPRTDSAFVMVDIELTNTDPGDIGPIGPTWGVDWNLVSADGTKLYDQTDYCPKVFDLFTASMPPEGGVDWNFGDEQLLAFPGEAKTFVACFEIDRDDIPGSTIEVGSAASDVVALATGL